MKRFILLLLAITALPFVTVAQSLDKALEQLEIVRMQNGEQSQEYLSALDTVILEANMAGDLETAFNFRKKHLDILKQLKGVANVEVAEDLWRLGNTSRRHGDVNESRDYYIQATDVFDKVFDFQMDSICVLHYALSLYTIIDDFVSLSDRDQVSYYSTELVEVSRALYKRNNCEHLGTVFQVLKFNNNVGNTDETVFEHYCNIIVNECDVIDSCDYAIVDYAYNYLKYYYFETKQYEQQIKIAKDQVNKLESANGPFTKELIMALYYLLANDNENIEDAIDCGKRAEKLLLDTYSSTEELYQDTMYYNTIAALAITYGVIGQNKSELLYNQLRRDVLEYNNQKENREYYEVLKFLFYSAYQSGEFHVVLNIAPDLEPMIFKYSSTPMVDACMYVECMAFVNMSLGKYQEAINYYDDALMLLPQIESGESLLLGKAHYSFGKAQVFHVTGLKQDALVLLSEIEKTLEELPELPQAQSLLVGVLVLKGSMASDYSESMACFDTAYCINERLLLETQKLLPITDQGVINIADSIGDVNVESTALFANLRQYLKAKAKIIHNKGIVQYNNGAITDSYRSFLEASSLFDKIKTENSDDYIACQDDIADCQMEMGNITDAINTLDRLLSVIKELYGEKNTYYVSVLSGMANYYSILGDYEKLINYSQIAASIYKEIGDTDGYAHSLLGIGTGCLIKGDLSNARYYLLESCKIMESQENDPKGLKKVFERLFELFSTMNDDAAAECFRKAEQITELAFGKQSIEFAELLTTAGQIMLDKGNEDAYEAFLEASNIMASLGWEQHLLYLSSLLLSGRAGVMFSKPVRIDYVKEAKKVLTTYYMSNIGYFSSKDRVFLWNRVSTEAKNIMFSVRTNVSCDLDLFEYLLFSKTLLLSTSDKYKNYVFNTDQTEIIDQYRNIQFIQRAIDMQSFGQHEQSQPIELLYEKKTSLERKLVAEMKALGYSANDSITYYDVRRILKPDEIAIEFVDYYHLKEEKTNYVALLAKSTWENPVYVQLCTEGELKSYIGNPNVTYSTDDLYRLLWQPLAGYINEGDRVYFSPSGMLHTIALESLHTPDGSCLSDKYNLVRLTSTRELCKERHPKTYETGAVYGGLQYDVDQQRMAEVAVMSNSTATKESPVFALRGEDRGNWNYLQGTKDEVEHIAGIMRQANIGCQLFEGDLGNEESFKALSGSDTDIIHLATHGYFIEGEKADMNDFMQSLSPLARQKTDSIIDPLLRSGLILSGGNRAWLGQEVPEGIEDGVLTALEISTMNLSGTDMVVMSACETGLGDITSDGVFGLQRAFKMAGVQTLVMSLWKVDDNATSLMMQTFYEHLLSGSSKRDAFNLAQAAVRAKYPEPYYWAGFVMLD